MFRNCWRHGFCVASCEAFVCSSFPFIRYIVCRWDIRPYSHRCNHHSMPQLIPDYPGHKPPRWRYLRSFVPVIVLILLFFFLSSYSLLSHSKSPAAKQHIGWQAWDVVDMTSQTEEGDNEEVGNETGNSNGTDTTFIPSIPLDNWVSTMICSTYRIAHANLRIL